MPPYRLERKRAATRDESPAQHERAERDLHSRKTVGRGSSRRDKGGSIPLHAVEQDAVVKDPDRRVQPRHDLTPLNRLGDDSDPSLTEIALSGGFDLTGLRGFRPSRNTVKPDRHVLRSTERQEFSKFSITRSQNGQQKNSRDGRSSKSLTDKSSLTSDRSEQSGLTDSTGQTIKTSAYSAGFELYLRAFGIYGPDYLKGNPSLPQLKNRREIEHELDRHRSNIGVIGTDTAFDGYVSLVLNQRANESLVSSIALSYIAGFDEAVSSNRVSSNGHMMGNVRLDRASILTQWVTKAPKPDFMIGQFTESIRELALEGIMQHIQFSSNNEMPVCANVYFELKGPRKDTDVGLRQAILDGALGAHAMQTLRTFVGDSSNFDLNGYAIVVTFDGVDLAIYTSYPAPPAAESQGRTRYLTTRLRRYEMTENQETFMRGVSALRNAIEWAARQRQSLIEEAKKRASRSKALRNCYTSSSANDRGLDSIDEEPPIAPVHSSGDGMEIATSGAQAHASTNLATARCNNEVSDRTPTAQPRRSSRLKELER